MGDFKLARELDESLLLDLGLDSDTPRGLIVEAIKEYLVRRGKNCAICGKRHDRKQLQIGRRRPASKGGGDKMGNLQLICPKCVEIKGDNTMLEVRKMLRSRKNSGRSPD